MELRMDDQRHDVFICFRGDEPFGTSTIRRAIVKPLFDSLTKTGASVFMDNESIESSQLIPDTILQGILRTRGGGAALILVSPDFFSRVWPLIELACFYKAQHYPDQDQIHLFIVCLNVTPEFIKQAAFVKEKCPGVQEVKFVVAPTHIRCNESTQVVGWLCETLLIWIKSNCVALGRTRTDSFNYFNARLSHLLSQREILETIAIHLGLFQLIFPKDPCSFFDVLAAANKVNKLTEGHIIYFQQALSGLNLDGKFSEVAKASIKFVERYNKKWLDSETLDQVPPLQEEKSEIEKWFKSPFRLHLEDSNNSVFQAVSSQPALTQTNSMTNDSSTQPPSTPVQHTFQPVGQVGNFDLNRSFHAASMSSEQTEGSQNAIISASYFCWKNNVPQGYFGTGSLYLIFPEKVDLPSLRNSPNVKIVQVDAGVEFEVNATNTWSWPLTLDEHGVLNDTVRNNLALLIASFDLEGICRFRVHQILSSEENDRYAVFFMPSEREIQTARSIVEQEGFMEKFEQAYNTFDATAKDQVAFCGGCGVVQRPSPDNPYLCRLGHLQAVHILDQPILSEKTVKVDFEWMPHNLDRRVDLLMSCEQHDEIVSSLKDYFLHDTYSVITSENREMSSFLQAVLSTRGGGIALVLMTKNYMIQSRTISELACLYEVRQDIRLIIACVGTTKSQVLQHVIIQELCPDLSSHLFLEYDEDSVDSLLKNKISQELLQHVIPGFRRDQSYLVLKDRLAACFENSPGRVFAKIAINLDLESISVMNWSDLFKQAELNGKFGEEQMDQFRQAIVILPETEINSNDRTSALKIIQRYEKKWLANWTSKKVPPLDKIDERAHLVNNRFRASLYKTLTGHTDTARSVAFSPDSKLIASASADCTVRLWNILNDALNAELKGHEGAVSSVAFSPDGKSIVTGSGDKTVRTWSVATKQQVKILNGHSDKVYSVAWSPNGDVIASGSDDNTVILWDAISGSMKKKLTGHTDSVWNVSFSQNGNKLASAGWDETVIIWDVHSGATLIKLNHSSYVLSVCFSRDDQFVVTGCNDGIVRMFNVNTGREAKRFEGHTETVSSVACSFDGSIIASGSNDNSVRLWDVASTNQLQQLHGHTNWVRSVTFSRDGKFIASASDDKSVCLWNAPSSLQTPTSLLKAACFAGDLDAAKFQLDQGALVNNKDGSTALYAASSKGSKQLVELLIERGADINLRENSGSSAFHAASSQGHQEVVAYLLDCGFSIDDNGTGVGSSDKQQSKKRQRENESNYLARETAVNHVWGLSGVYQQISRLQKDIVSASAVIASLAFAAFNYHSPVPQTEGNDEIRAAVPQTVGYDAEIHSAPQTEGFDAETHAAVPQTEGYDVEIHLVTLLPQKIKDVFRVVFKIYSSPTSVLHEPLKKYITAAAAKGEHIPSIYDDYPNYSSGTVVFMGPYGVGKTFVLKQLSGKSSLPYEGTDKHTPSLCYLWVFGRNKKFQLFVDTAGGFMPLMLPSSEQQFPPDAGETKQQPPTERSADQTLTEDEMIQDRKQTDLFQRHLVLKQANVVILVFDDLQWPHQEMLAHIRRDLCNLHESEEIIIIVVHNWKNVTTQAQLENKFYEQVVNAYDARFGTVLHDIESNVPYFRSNAKATKDEPHLPSLRHVILGNHDKLKEHNEATFKLLRSWINDKLTSTEHLNPLQHIEQACKPPDKQNPNQNNCILEEYLTKVDELAMHYELPSRTNPPARESSDNESTNEEGDAVLIGSTNEEGNGVLIGNFVSKPIPVPEGAKRPNHMFVREHYFMDGSFISAPYRPLKMSQRFSSDNVIIDVFDVPGVDYVDSEVFKDTSRASELNSHFTIDFQPANAWLVISVRREASGEYRDKSRKKLPNGVDNLRINLAQQGNQPAMAFHSAFLYFGQLFMIYRNSNGHEDYPTELPIADFKRLHKEVIQTPEIDEKYVKKLYPRPSNTTNGLDLQMPTVQTEN